jgi:glycosyltransferase involved in cell wall biosynthesis
MAEDGGPKVTIVVPTYNDSDVLPRAIRSVLEQSYKNVEIIVVDDASDEPVYPLLVEKFPEEDRIKVRRHFKNKMLGGARNTGIDAATGDYIFFLDADDRLLPDALSHLVSTAVSTDADVVQGGTLIGSSDHDLRPYHAFEFASEGNIDGLELFSAHRYASIACAKLYRRTLLTSSGGIRFAEKYMHEDVAFSAQTAFHAKRILSISYPTLHYTTQASSLTRKTPTRFNIESYLSTYLALIEVLRKLGVGRENHRALFLRILSAHLSADFGPKLSDCYVKMGHEPFKNEILSVGEQQFGDYGLAVGDLITELAMRINSQTINTVLAPVTQKIDAIMADLSSRQTLFSELLSVQKQMAADQLVLATQLGARPSARDIAKEVMFERQRWGLPYKISKWFKSR